MAWYKNSILWGVLIMLGGAALLVQNLLGLPLGGIFWGCAAIIIGFFFLKEAWTDLHPWWPIIPGSFLIGLGLSALVGAFLPAISFIRDFLPLGVLGIGFFFVYIREQSNWWALIPGGVLITLGIVSLLDAINLGIDTGGIFFLGLGLTFFALTLLPNKQLSWAYIPAMVLTAISAFIGIISGQANSNIFWALILILAGCFMVIRSIRSRQL